MTVIERDAHIPNAVQMARTTLETARDQKRFGRLKDVPLDEESIAFVMKYSAEDTVPPLYKAMNDACYNPDRSYFTPFAPFVVSTVLAMKCIEPYDREATVFRGVKADLRADYVEGRELTWYGFCSTTKSMAVLSNPMFCGDAGKFVLY